MNDFEEYVAKLAKTYEISIEEARELAISEVVKQYYEDVKRGLI